MHWRWVCSQRAQARKRLREKEEEEDASDRIAETYERAAKAQRGESMDGETLNNLDSRCNLVLVFFAMLAARQKG